MVWGEVGNALKQHLCRQHVNDTEVRFISLTPWLMDILQSIHTRTHTAFCVSINKISSEHKIVPLWDFYEVALFSELHVSMCQHYVWANVLQLSARSEGFQTSGVFISGVLKQVL